MAETKEFYCLRCQARFPMEHDPAKVVERSCPKCGSNSVRLAPSPKAGETKGG
jgi:ribosomal protein L40E